MGVLSEFSSVIDGAQRANKFYTMFFTRTDGVNEIINPLSIIASNIPGVTLGTISFHDMGTKYSIAGDTTFQPWSVKIRTYEYKDYDVIKKWFESIHKPFDGKRALPSEYKAICTVQPIDYNYNKDIITFILKGVFPISIGDIQLSEDSNELITFDVTLNIDDMTTKTNEQE